MARAPFLCSHHKLLFQRLACILLLLAGVPAIYAASGTGGGTGGDGGGGSKGDSPSGNGVGAPADLRSCPGLRIALINGVPYHYDVTAGLLYTLRPYTKRLDVILNRYTRSGTADGAWDVLKWSKGSFKYLTPALVQKEPPEYDLAILVSADYEPPENLEVLRKLRLKTIVAIVHNHDYKDLSKLMSWTKDVRLLTLSPHVADAVEEAARKAAPPGKLPPPVDWALPTLPFKPRTSCLHATEVDLMGGCVHGFVLQGKFSNLRRNYSSIWTQISTRLPDLTAGPSAHFFGIKVLGKGDDARLNIPEDLMPHAKIMKRLQFRSFWDVIHHSFALIPALASDKYYNGKFSSTIVTSLTAGTPVIADDRFLAAYRMFTNASVYYQAPGEQEVDVMLRVMRTPALQVRAVRHALVEVRRQLNVQAGEYFKGVLEDVCRIAVAGGGQGKG